MSERKFRGKIESGLLKNHWIKGNYYIRKFDENYKIKDYIIYKDNIAYPIKENTLNMFTGVYDINGKEIYDNDIVRYNNKTLTGESFGLVTYQNKNNYYSYYIQFYRYDGQLVKGNKWFNRNLLKSDENNTYEVIGNITDNPELMTNFSEQVRLNDRIIKFRGYTVENNFSWVYGFYYSINQFNTESQETETLHYIKSPDNSNQLVNPDTVCQYTGFNDSAGTEIYEKDIIQFTETNLTGIVYWDNISGSYRLVYDCANPKSNTLAEGIGSSINNYKVISTYFDRPEFQKILEENREKEN